MAFLFVRQLGGFLSDLQKLIGGAVIGLLAKIVYDWLAKSRNGKATPVGNHIDHATWRAWIRDEARAAIKDEMAHFRGQFKDDIRAALQSEHGRILEQIYDRQSDVLQVLHTWVKDMMNKGQF